MTISNLNGVISGFQPLQPVSRNWATPPAARAIDLWYSAGIGNSGGTPDTTLVGVALSSTSANIAGQFFHFDPPGGSSAYLTRFQASVSAQVGIVMLCDRLWHNGGMTITSTSAQTINSATWPARDNNGATTGDGVLIGLSVSALTSGGPPTAVLSYTNTAGTASRSASLLETTSGAATVGMFYRFGLQAGDSGVQSIQSITFTNAWASGTVNLVAYRVLAVLEIPNINYTFAIDAVNGGFPQLYNGVVPFPVYVPTGLTASNIVMGYLETQG